MSSGYDLGGMFRMILNRRTILAQEKRDTFWQRLENQVRLDGEDERVRLASATAIAQQILDDNTLGRPWMPSGCPVVDVQDQSGAITPDGNFDEFLDGLRHTSWRDVFKSAGMHDDSLKITYRRLPHSAPAAPVYAIGSHLPETADLVTPLVNVVMPDGTVRTEYDGVVVDHDAFTRIYLMIENIMTALNESGMFG